MPSGLSAFSELGSTLKQAVEGAVAAARLDNSVDAPQQQPAVWEERQALKPLMKGALLELEGVEGTFAFVPPGRTLVSREGGDVLTVFSDVGPAKERDETWLNANVKTFWPGICTIEGKAGACAALKVANIPATVSPVAATPITMAVVTVGGSAQQPQEIVKALKQLGLSGQGRPWGGGAQGVALVAADGVPKADDATAIMISATAFVGGGAFAASTVASLVTLGLEVVDGNVQCGRAARIMCAVADAGGLAGELAVALATTESAAAGGEAGVAELPPRDRIAAAAAKARVALGAALGLMDRPTLLEAMATVEELRDADAWETGGAQLGSVLRKVCTAQSPPPPQPPVRAPAPAAMAAPPDSAADIDALVERVEGRLRAPLPPAAAPLSPHTFVHAVASLSPAPLAGQPEPTPIEMWRNLGGTMVISRMSEVNPRGIVLLPNDPLAMLDAAGGEEAAAAASADLAMMIEALSGRALMLPPGAPQLPTIIFEHRPRDWSEARARLHGIIRAGAMLKTAPATVGVHASAAAGTAPKLPPGASVAVKEATTSGKAPAGSELGTPSSRAVPAEVLASVVGAGAGWRGVAFTPTPGETVANARSLIRTLGNNVAVQEHAARSYLLSNGTSRGAVAGEIPTPLQHARLALHGHIRHMVETVIGCPRRVAEKEQMVDSLAEGILTGEVPYLACVTLLASTSPTSGWVAARSASSLSLGVWGTTTGATAQIDMVTAMERLAPLLRIASVEIGGAPSPSDESFGLVTLAKKARSVELTVANAFWQQFFAKAATLAKAARADPSAPPLNWEALALEGATLALDPMANAEDAAAAGRKAALEAISSRRGSGGGGGGGGGGGDDDDAAGKKRGSNKDRKKERSLARADKRRKEEQVAKAAAPGAAPAAATATAAGDTTTAVISPFDAKLLQPNSIKCFVTKSRDGTGLVEMFDRCHKHSQPGVPRERAPCAWRLVKDGCHAHSEGKCPRCAQPSPASADAGICAKLLAACTDNMKGKLAALPSSCIKTA
jgi:hypothetical protein